MALRAHPLLSPALATALWLAFSLSALAVEPVGELLPAEYLRCTDGDTIVVALGSVETKVRLTGVEAPEMEGTAAGFESAAACARQCEEAVTLWLEIDAEKPKDRYGRTLAWVWVGDTSGEKTLLNTWLIENGFALIYPSEEATRYLHWSD